MKSKSYLSIILLILTSILLFVGKVSGATWTSIVLDNRERVGSSTSIAVDGTDNVHTSYVDSDNDGTNPILKYITNVSGSWIAETVDSSENEVQDAAIAIDSSDKVHISYVDFDSDGTNRNLKYITNVSGSWVIMTIDSGRYVGWDTAIAIDSSDNVHISYLYYDYDSADGDLKYATNATGSWVTSTVDSSGSVGRYLSIAIDSTDNAHISYFDETNIDIKYATNASGSWVTETVDGFPSNNFFQWDTSIALDSSDNVHICYHYTLDGFEIITEGLKYASNVSGLWVTETVDFDTVFLGIVDTGKYNSMAIDSSGNAHISYYDGILRYTTNSSGSWVTETVDRKGSVGFHTSIALDTSGKVHISYFDDTNHDLKYATTHVPVPDINANVTDVLVTPTDNLSVTVALDPASRSGDDADWWVAADTPYGWFYLVANTMSWELAGTSHTDLLVTHQGTLFNLSTVEVLNIPVAGLLPGTYKLYFAVDTNRNGVLDFAELYYDSVVVNITP